MIKVQRSRAKPRQAKTGAGRRDKRASITLTKDPVQNDQLREFMRAMSVELSDLAYKNGFDALAVVFDMAREVAETDVSTSDEHLRRP